MPERVPVLLYTVGLWLGNCAREGTSVTIHCRAMARELCQRGYQYYYTL